ncbi:unnamed protein product [Owenia fusiformis]|uniref:Fructose-2,6-bisphosphatase TIGAR n=1 Tax=Owenia fusiformis TaxID=6347 RepID=A0A8S4PX24_OWEFU|nr:unnamed protein product [Owenia fusiformis]
MIVFNITLIRHGETEANKQSIVQGQSDSTLTEEGCRQAKLVGERLQNEQFTHTYSSDLGRCLNTTELILSCNKICQQQITTSKLLRERNFGIFQGRPSSEMKDAAKKANKSFADYVPPGAETKQQMQQRTRVFFEDLCQTMRNTYKDSSTDRCSDLGISPIHGTPRSRTLSTGSGRITSSDDEELTPSLSADVLIVTHGGFLKAIIKTFIDDYNCVMTIGKGLALRISPNCGLSKFKVYLEEDRKPHIVCLALHEADHLQTDSVSQCQHAENAN